MQKNFLCKRTFYAKGLFMQNDILWKRHLSNRTLARNELMACRVIWTVQKHFLIVSKYVIGGIEICIWISCECKYKYSCNRISTRKLIVKYYLRERVFVEFYIISAGIVFRCLSRHISFGTKTSKGKNCGLFS